MENFNDILVDLLNNKLTNKYLDRIQECNTFKLYYTNSTYDKKKLVRANSCRNRFCPICYSRYMYKNYIKISTMLKYVKNLYNCKFIFLTLTAPNVSGEELENELESYYKSFERLAKTKEFKKINLGYIRKLEVTYNEDRNDYHPYYHVILAVKKSYFTSRDYLSKKKWLALWKRSKMDESITQIKIQEIEYTDINLVVNCLTKRTLLDKNLYKNTEVFDTFYSILKGRRLLSFNKIFKNIGNEYKSGKLDYLKEVDTTRYINKLTCIDGVYKKI